MAAVSFTRDYLKSTGVGESLRGLILLVRSCYGPDSRLKLLQNDIGGHVTVTSASGRLLNLMYAEEPIVKVLVTAVKKHIQLNIDGGLFCLGLAASLVHDSRSLDQSRVLIGRIYHDLHKILEDYYQTETVEGVRKMDFTSVDDLMALCGSVIRPKSGCVLYESEFDHICKTLVEAFVRSFSPEALNSASDIQIVYLQGSSPQQVTYIEGLLFEMDLDSRMATLSLPSNVKFVMVTCSMAGDHGDDDDVARVGKENMVMDDVINEDVYRLMTSLCDRWVSDGVTLVLCQKVVHWKVVGYLRKFGVAVIQRLGLQTTQYVLKITGGEQVASILQPPDDDVYGTLRDVSTVEYCGKMYYQLNVLDPTITSTLLVVNRTEESLAELQYVCRAAVDSLRLAARHPRLIRGQGYFENHSAQYLREQVRLRQLRLQQTHQCSRVHLYTITEQFCQSLQSIVCHFSPHPPNHASNLVNNLARLSLRLDKSETEITSYNESESVDLLCIKLAALHTAVFTACGLIQVDALYEIKSS